MVSIPYVNLVKSTILQSNEWQAELKRSYLGDIVRYHIFILILASE